jgi:hypothetical protein
MFVEGYRLIDGKLYFTVPVRAQTYHGVLRVFDPATGKLVTQRDKPDARFSRHWHIALGKPLKRVRVEFTIEGALAFSGIISQQEVLGL